MSRSSRRTGLVLAWTAAALVAGCGGSGDPATLSPGLGLTLTPASVTLRPGETAEVRAAVSRPGGFVGAVTLAPLWLPQGVTVRPVTLSEDVAGASLLVEAGGGATPDTVEVPVEARASGVEPARASVSVVVGEWEPRGGFTLTLHPSPLSIRPGQSDSVRVTVSRVAPFSGPVRLEVVELSPDVTALVDPVTVEGTQAFILVDVAPGAPLGDAGLTVVGRAEGVPDQAVRLVLTTFGASFPDLPPVNAPPPS